jgi:hypothetical protein
MPNSIGPYLSKALNHRHMNGPAIQPRAPFFESNTPFLRDRMAFFTSDGLDGDLTSNRYPNG